MNQEIPTSSSHVVVVGAGIIGLACSLLLVEGGHQVTVVARDMPGDGGTRWASPWAGAILVPPPDMGNAEMAKESYRWYRALAEKDASSSVKVTKATEYFTDRDTDESLWYKGFFPKYRRLSISELPTNCKIGVSYETCIVNPEVFLPWLKRKLVDLGVVFIRAEVTAFSDVSKYISKHHLIINASGLGAQSLASDDTVIGYRGQTLFVKSDFDEVRMIQGSEFTYVIPRMFSGGVIIGGISQESATDTAVDTELRLDILRRVNKMTNDAFAHIDLEHDEVKDIVGIRPGRRDGLRVECEGQIIHAYGFKGAGYIFSFGAAAKVRELASSMLAQPRAW